MTLPSSSKQEYDIKKDNNILNISYFKKNIAPTLYRRLPIITCKYTSTNKAINQLIVFMTTKIIKFNSQPTQY